MLEMHTVGKLAHKSNQIIPLSSHRVTCASFRHVGGGLIDHFLWLDLCDMSNRGLFAR